jgi:hypothetical protein
LCSDQEESKKNVDIVREITEFSYRKWGRRLQVGSLPGGMEVPHAGKKGKDFFFFFFGSTGV